MNDLKKEARYILTLISSNDLETVNDGLQHWEKIVSRDGEDFFTFLWFLRRKKLKKKYNKPAVVKAMRNENKWWFTDVSNDAKYFVSLFDQYIHQATIMVWLYAKVQQLTTLSDDFVTICTQFIQPPILFTKKELEEDERFNQFLWFQLGVGEEPEHLPEWRFHENEYEQLFIEIEPYVREGKLFSKKWNQRVHPRFGQQGGR